MSLDSKFVTLAREWYDGSGSMLYAIASTGDLTCGTIPPVRCGSNDEWYCHLWDVLDCELSAIIRGLENEKLVNCDYNSLCEFQQHAEQMADSFRPEEDDTDIYSEDDDLVNEEWEHGHWDMSHHDE